MRRSDHGRIVRPAFLELIFATVSEQFTCQLDESCHGNEDMPTHCPDDRSLL
jgi:hypothetical protein